jgi:uncharacterized metal-binding protein YceD (DUF177 family)
LTQLALGKFEAYQVDLKNMAPAEVCTHKYLLENKFFMDIDGTEVHKGTVNVSLVVECKNSSFEMKFHIAGVVFVPCDRCLDDVEVPVETNNRLIVKFGREYAEESDEILVISKEEGSLNLAWFLYEFVALAIPAKHIHPPGRCNKTMTSKLKKHSARRTDEEEDRGDNYAGEGDDVLPDEENEPEQQPATDPRWEALKDLM